ncbi:Acetyltransferase (GNAT) domain-containing protein [Reichenbachiella faecimaris]|uniref:Acetyltransferase (GNAT) domain-containing protein n=1 Tax=Reichenbachiella faecimaris TaxID=692418 RepID=A0A1W2GJE0_REIFA|nr:GNAT family N-acetyltransferase [Reichenbachiella faecimaris]SMD36664.1 Acetyltransferase (GNAT) domain-containing protein [Reichenbachiella faecimaris]
MSTSRLIIRKGTIEEVVTLSRQIPEFDNPHKAKVYEQRLNENQHLIAIAELDRELAGFKVGYDKFNDKSFYTWMGGVLPQFRKSGVAKALAQFQEEFALMHGFETIVLKTRNKHKNMLHFALSSGFDIIEVEVKSDTLENRIILRKKLNN